MRLKRLDTKKIVILSIVIFFIMGLISIWGRDYFASSLFDSHYHFSSVGQVSANNDGSLFVLDNGSKTILELDENYNLIRQLDGGSLDAKFYYATHFCKDLGGNTLISDIIYGNNGNKIERERVILLEGNKSSVLYDKDYTQTDNPPLQYGRINDLKCDDKGVFFIVKEEDKIIINRINQNNDVVEYKTYPCDEITNSIAFEDSSDNVVIATRTGHIKFYDNASKEWATVKDYKSNMIPVSISIRDGMVYYSELSTSNIIRFKLSEKENVSNASDITLEEFFNNGIGFYRLNHSYKNDNTLFMHDLGIIYCLSNGEFTEISTVKCAYYYIIVIVHIATIICSISILFFIILILRKIIKSILSSTAKEDISKILLIAIGMILVACIVSYSSISQMMGEQNKSVMDEMSMFSKLMASEIDGDVVKEFGIPDDFNTPKYNEVKKILDRMIETSYETKNFYYYIILKPNQENGSFDLIMDYEASKPCGTPVYEWGDNEYVEAYDTQSTVLIEGDTSSYGAWTYVLTPIYDKNGNVCNVLEVGTSLDKLTAYYDGYFKDTALAILASATVMIMLILEIMFAVNFYENKNKDQYKNTYEGISVPIRLMVFTAYMADCMQDAFIAIMCSSLYNQAAGGWIRILPREIAIAFPMSIQLLMAAIASLVGGRLSEKFGTKRVMVTGFFMQTLGFITCAAFLNYTGVLFGKCFIGLGEGLVYVSANTMSAMGRTEEARTKAFADVSAGVLSGVTIGVGLGSVLLSMGNYRLVYIVGAILLATTGLVSLSAENLTMEHEIERAKISVFTFITNKKVWSFFILMIVPFMMALSFRDYFFPLFVEDFGMTEVRIGQVYLFCGMAVLYLGPWLSNTLISKIGAKGSIILSAFLMIVAMGSYLVFPTVAAVIVGVAILYFTISFAYTCQYYYFEELPIVTEYGEGKSMGIYSMFESLGQTLGPIVFGLALTAGNWKGILIIAIGMFILAVLYIGLNWGKNKR